MVAVRMCGVPVADANDPNNKPSDHASSNARAADNGSVESTVPILFNLPDSVVRESDLRSNATNNNTAGRRKIARINVHDAAVDIESEEGDVSSTKKRPRRLSVRFLDSPSAPSYSIDGTTGRDERDVDENDLNDIGDISINESSTVTQIQHEETLPNPVKEASSLSIPSSTTRFLIKKRIVIGNVSRYIFEDKRKLPKYEFKWMLYVQGPPSNPDITCVDKFRFDTNQSSFTHSYDCVSDYKPNNVVDVSTPPFQVTRYGWGEFPVRVRLFFVDPARNKSVDIMFTIKLDQTLTGTQVLGNEIWTDVTLDRNTEFPQTNGGGVNNALETAWVPSVLAANATVEETRGFGRSLGSSARQRGRTAAGGHGAARSNAAATARDKRFLLLEADTKMNTDGDALGDTLVKLDPQDSAPVIDGVVAEMLQGSVADFPLYGPLDKPLVLDYGIPSSVEEYDNLDRDRKVALEKSRATALLRHLQSKPTNSNHPILSVTVADVIMWCRRNSLELTAHEVKLNKEDTQLASGDKSITKVSYCKFCGREHVKSGELSGLDSLAQRCISELQPMLSAFAAAGSLSSAKALIESAKTLKAGKPTGNLYIDEDFAANIMHQAGSRISHNEQVFVWSTVAQIGVAVPSLDDEYPLDARNVVDEDEKGAMSARKAVGGLIFEAMRVFARRLVRECESVFREQTAELAGTASDDGEATQTLTQANARVQGLLVPMHVRLAVLRADEFDFLTQRHLGL
ncbi:YEATS domain-containing protein 2 [Entophlyctis luteolus]|nr:YEATS domain-containing protein 2 [Entophlyctis luteolus]